MGCSSVSQSLHDVILYLIFLRFWGFGVVRLFSERRSQDFLPHVVIFARFWTVADFRKVILDGFDYTYFALRGLLAKYIRWFKI